MGVFRNILFCSLAAGALLCGGCSDDDADVLPNQQERFESYLRSTHSPQLIAESELGESLEESPEYYTTAGSTAYRYIAGIYDPERASRTEVAWGDTVWITFRIYVFSFSNITSTTMPYYSNDPELKEAYEQTGGGLNPEYWTFEPLEIKLGETRILKGLELTLAGCREGDEVEVYMTYNLGYGDDLIGIIPKQSPLAVYFTVDKIEKN